FVERFLNKGPMGKALQSIPVKLVEHGQLGVIGAASWYLESRPRKPSAAYATDVPAAPVVTRHFVPTIKMLRRGNMHRKTLLSAAIVSCLAFRAHAQEAPQSATDLDTVTVTGIRGSMEDRKSVV